MSALALSRFDQICRSVILTKFFIKGWGTTENLQRLFRFRKVLMNRTECQKLVAPDYPVVIENENRQDGYDIIIGKFRSPFSAIFPDIDVPDAVKTAHFEAVIPHRWRYNKLKPVAIHLASTGDHKFRRRRTLMGKPLALNDGVASILVENPFYGYRKPPEQTLSSLHNVTDLFVMGGSLVLESIVLLHWAERRGWGPHALTGISMGGHMASISATNWHKPVALVPCLSWSTASTVFTEGVMSGAIPWEVLRKQFYSESFDKETFLAHLKNPELYSHAYNLGKEFAASTTRDSSRGHSTMAMKNLATATDSNSSVDATKEEVVQFMAGLLDEFTHLVNYSKPVDTSLIIVVAANRDAYVPRQRVVSLSDLWPEAEIRYIDRGHVTAVLFDNAAFRKAIVDALDKTANKHFADQLS